MNIKEAAQASGLPAKTIRYYEEIGLLHPRRSENGYRVFDAKAVEQLGFLSHARALGFTIEDCRALLALRENPARASSDVKRIAQDHLEGIGARIAALEAMRQALSGMIARCAGDAGADCAILAKIEEAPEAG